MNDFLNMKDRSNNAVLARTADGMSLLTAQLVDKLRRQDRKVNSGATVQAKPVLPWYRRFDKR